MRYTFLITIFLTIIISGCGKDKFNTTPSLEFNSVNTTDLHQHGILKFVLDFTDAEGDISNMIYIKKEVPGCTASEFEQEYPVPDFPSSVNQKGEIIVQFGYDARDGAGDEIPGVKAPTCNHNDTAVFYFVLKDLKGHASDTATSPPIIIYE